MVNCPLCDCKILGSVSAHTGWCRVERMIEKVMDETLNIERREDDA